MSNSLDALIYVKETPWHNMGAHLDSEPTSLPDAVSKAGLDWTVSTTPMYTIIHPAVMNYKAVYRDDTEEVLGVVNTAHPQLVQNIDTFKPIEDLVKDGSVKFQNIGTVGHGEKMWACLKLTGNYKVLDDEVEHYLVVVNDHLRPNGKISVLNTPVRVACQNALDLALNKAFYHVDVPVFINGSTMEVAMKVFNTAEDAVRQLNKRAEAMVDAKIDKAYVDALLDKLFPYPDDVANLNPATAEKISLIRTQFVDDCLGADNLANYRGTQWQVFNACVDFDTHYFKSASKAFDPNYRMKLLRGLAVDTSASTANKFMKMKDRLAA